jgi:hypothetical protein
MFMSLPNLLQKDSAHNCTGKQTLMRLVFQKPVNAEYEEFKNMYVFLDNFYLLFPCALYNFFRHWSG